MPDRRSALIAELRAAGCVFAEEEADQLLEADPADDVLAELVRRRVAGEPLEYVVGHVDFDGLRLAVDPGVFIPRQRTRFLVEVAARLTGWGDVVVDLCCGTGALGLAVRRRVGEVDLHAADLDQRATDCAARNLAEVGGRVYTGDLFAALPQDLRGTVATVLANVPYVPSADLDLMPFEARRHEPVGTHDGGADGLDVLRRVVAAAPAWLAPGGHVLFEIHPDQAPETLAAMTRAGLEAAAVTPDDLGDARDPEDDDRDDTTVAVGRMP